MLKSRHELRQLQDSANNAGQKWLQRKPCSIDKQIPLEMSAVSLNNIQVGLRPDEEIHNTSVSTGQSR